MDLVAMDLMGDVHNLGETGNTEHVVNVVGDIRNGKLVFSEGSATDQTNPQKGGGNKYNIGEIKGQPNIFTIILKIGHSPQQRLLDFGANVSVKSAQKLTV